MALRTLLARVRGNRGRSWRMDCHVHASSSPRDSLRQRHDSHRFLVGIDRWPSYSRLCHSSHWRKACNRRKCSHSVCFLYPLLIILSLRQRSTCRLQWFWNFSFGLIPQFYVSAVSVALIGFFLGPLFPAAVVAATKLLPKHLHVSAIGFAAALGGGGAAIFPFCRRRYRAGQRCAGVAATYSCSSCGGPLSLARIAQAEQKN